VIASAYNPPDPALSFAVAEPMQSAPLKTPPPSRSAHTLAEAFALAGVVVGRVLEGDSLTRAMAEVRVSGALRAAVQDLAFSALRDYGNADAVLGLLVTRPPTASLRGLLLAAIVELQRGPQSDHAVVHQAVEATARVAPRGGTAAKGLVNAVLRNFLRQRDALQASINSGSTAETARHRHPQWWIDRVRCAWPQQWEGILAAGNEQASMTLRVNRRRSDGAAYLARLQAEGMSGVLLGAQAIRLDRPVPVERLPGFREGEVSVQDWGAQQAAPLLDVKAGMRVLDACAAPGGKSAHLAELVDCELTAIDVDAVRLERVQGNLQRLGLPARVKAADVLKPEAWLQQCRFDRILADVPCSASGVVRRHPDIKWLRRASDIDAFTVTQRAMLDALWLLLKPGGKFLYVTCSVFPQENAAQATAFLASHHDAKQLPISGLDSDSLRMADDIPDGVQILPGPNSDGFFYALMEKLP